jgi:hypothetical protein
MPEITRNAGVWMDIEELVKDCHTGILTPEARRALAGPDTPGDEFFEALPPPDLLLDPIVKDCVSLGVGVINMPWAEPLLPLIPRFKTRGIQISLWTLDKREILERAFGLGVLNITTRDTRLALDVRGSLFTRP